MGGEMVVRSLYIQLPTFVNYLLLLLLKDNYAHIRYLLLLLLEDNYVHIRYLSLLLLKNNSYLYPPFAHFDDRTVKAVSSCALCFLFLDLPPKTQTLTMAMTKEELDALLAAPAMEPPEDVTPDFENHPNRNGLALVVTTLCLAVSILCVILRTYARVYKIRAIHMEESKKPYVLGLYILLLLIDICYLLQSACFSHWELSVVQLMPATR